METNLNLRKLTVHIIVVFCTLICTLIFNKISDRILLEKDFKIENEKILDTNSISFELLCLEKCFNKLGFCLYLENNLIEDGKIFISNSNILFPSPKIDTNKNILLLEVNSERVIVNGQKLEFLINTKNKIKIHPNGLKLDIWGDAKLSESTFRVFKSKRFNFIDLKELFSIIITGILFFILFYKVFKYKHLSNYKKLNTNYFKKLIEKRDISYIYYIMRRASENDDFCKSIIDSYINKGFIIDQLKNNVAIKYSGWRAKIFKKKKYECLYNDIRNKCLEIIISNLKVSSDIYLLTILQRLISYSIKIISN